MGAVWEDQDYDISRIVKAMVPPPADATTVYRPGEQGFLEKDLTHRAGTTPLSRTDINVNTPGGPQARLEQLESFYPGGAATPRPASAISGVSAPATERPKYSVPPEMQQYFDDAIKAVTGRSADVELLRDRAQGFGLGMVFGKNAAKLRGDAAKALVDVENTRRSAIANLSNSMATLMMEPSRFARDMYGKELEYDLGRRREVLGERRLDLEESKIRREAPATAVGLGEGGEKTLFGWDPGKKTWTTISRGALPIEVNEGNRLIDPVSGKVIGEGGKRSRFNEALATTAFKAYADEMKAIEEKYSLAGLGDDKKIESRKKARGEAENAAWERLSSHMGNLGYGDMFKPRGAGETSGKPNFATFKQAARDQGSKMSEDDLKKAYEERYGAAR